MPLVHDYESEWADVVAANKAILELNHHGKGPVHINLETNYSKIYSTQPLPEIRSIKRYCSSDKLPSLGNYSKIAIMVGAHTKWSKELTRAVDAFCETHNAIALCDHCSNYNGKYRVLANILTQQYYSNSVIKTADFVIHIGEISASNYNINMNSVSQIAEKQESIVSLTAEIASITANIDTLKADLKEKKSALRKVEKEVTTLEAKKAKVDDRAAEEAKKAEAESVVKRLLASRMSADEILEKLK